MSRLLRCIAVLLFALAASAQIDSSNWGAVTAPVFGIGERGFAVTADLLAGPGKFGSYYSGVLPNGRIVKPAGTSIQVGIMPMGAALTPDGKYLVVSNDADRDQGLTSLQDAKNTAGFSLSVIDTQKMTVVSRTTTGHYFVGLQISGAGPYTAWVSAGPDNQMRLFNITAAGVISQSTPATITIPPILPANAGYVSNYIPGAALNASDASGNKPPVPTNFNRTAGASITYPAGCALSPDGRFLYVASNGDNSLAVIDTKTKTIVRQLPAGYFPYGVSVTAKGDQVLVSNWGVTDYVFANSYYDRDGKLTAIKPTGNNLPLGYYVPITSTEGDNPKTSSVSIYTAPAGDGAQLSAAGAVYMGKPLDEVYQVGDTHPSATAIVRQGNVEVLYVTKSNSDALGRVLLGENRVLPDIDIAPVSVTLGDGHAVHGAYPNALAVSPDNRRLYVAEAGLNSVAVFDTTDPLQPQLLGRIPTGWYPAAVAVSPDGQSLYIANSKGVGEDINPKAATDNPDAPSTGLQSVADLDSNDVFGSVQKVDLASLSLNNTTVLQNNFALHPPVETGIVPAGGSASAKIKHVFFILHENKTFDSMLGNMKDHFGPFASTVFQDRQGKAVTDGQFTGVSLNTQLLARTFAAAVNYYSDSEESDAGHQFCASGTASDYTEKTLNVKTGRGLLVNKNFEPEDYPESGYIFNNAARNGVSFKVFGDMSRIVGTDTGASTPTSLNDPRSGNAGYPTLKKDNFSVTTPPINAGDVDTPTQGLGQSYFLALPGLAVLGQRNESGEPRVDPDYPGYNFNISDQRRAKRFIADFDRMAALGTVPQFLYIYQPNDHTGAAQAPNAKLVLPATATSPLQQVADGDMALGMVVNHIMQSPIYYDPATGEGSAIFVTYDDAQATVDHIHPHRTPMIVISPYAKPGYVATGHYSTASIVKTEELLLGMPPNNLGDLFATDLRDMFQTAYNGIVADQVRVNMNIVYKVSPEGSRIWALANTLDLSGPDRDSHRLGALVRLSVQADDLHNDAARQGSLRSRSYKTAQQRLYRQAVETVE